MFDSFITRRKLIALASVALLAGCKVIPAGPPANVPPPVRPTGTPLPADFQRHRVALLVPLSGPNAGAGESLANATTMALLDTNATNLRITTYDTSMGAPAAAAKAVADGNKLILGPLLGEDAIAVATTAKAARVPVISYSNDIAVAGEGVFVMGPIPGQSITRVVKYARGEGVERFAALIPVGTYGERASNAMIAAVRASGGTLVGMESYDRTKGTLAAAVRRLKAHGAYDAVLIADSAAVAAQAAPLLKAGPTATAAPLRILGTELWTGEAVVASTPALAGSWFAGTSDLRYHRIATAYKARFAHPPYRISTLGYDSVLLTLRIAREWQPDSNFPLARLYDQGGFLGSDGVFRFGSNNVIERALEVREARGGAISVVSPAPTKFD